jgi:iron(III) transport system substrate-binding protein
MRARAILIVAAAALLLAACGSGSADGPLVVYSGRSEDLVGPLLDRFTDETGIELEVRYGESPELAATILTEGNRSPADVFFAQDPGSLGLVSLEGLFQPLPDEMMARVDPRFADADGNWIPVSGRSRVVVYNGETVGEDDLPQSMDDVVDPRWSGDVGVAPTNGSFLSFIAAMILSEGEETTAAWLEKLAANDPVTYPDNSSIVAAVESGEIALGLVNHYYLLRLDAEQGGTVARNEFLDDASAGSLVMPAGVGVLARSDRSAEATQLVDFLLSEEAQSYFADETYEYPMIDEVAANPALPELDQLHPPDVDMSELATVLDRAAELVTESGLV